MYLKYYRRVYTVDMRDMLQVANLNGAMVWIQPVLDIRWTIMGRHVVWTRPVANLFKWFTPIKRLDQDKLWDILISFQIIKREFNRTVQFKRPDVHINLLLNITRPHLIRAINLSAIHAVNLQDLNQMLLVASVRTDQQIVCMALFVLTQHLVLRTHMLESKLDLYLLLFIENIIYLIKCVWFSLF